MKILVRKIYADDKRYITAEDLKIENSETWEKLESEKLQNLTNSMPKIIFSNH